MKTKRRIDKIFEATGAVAERVALNKKVSVADIGTDHGFLAEKLSKAPFVESVIASDISEKSLHKLERLIERHSLKNIKTLVCDGLLGIDRVDIAVIAGLGGVQIMEMLGAQNRGKTEPKCRYFVLQPVQNVPELRQFLYDNHFDVFMDYVFRDSGQFYHILCVDVLCAPCDVLDIKTKYLGKNQPSSADFWDFVSEVSSKLEFLNDLPKDKIAGDLELSEKLSLKNVVDKFKNL